MMPTSVRPPRIESRFDMPFYRLRSLILQASRQREVRPLLHDSLLRSAISSGYERSMKECLERATKEGEAMNLWVLPNLRYSGLQASIGTFALQAEGKPNSERRFTEPHEPWRNAFVLYGETTLRWEARRLYEPALDVVFPKETREALVSFPTTPRVRRTWQDRLHAYPFEAENIEAMKRTLLFLRRRTARSQIADRLETFIDNGDYASDFEKKVEEVLQIRTSFKKLPNKRVVKIGGVDQ